MKLILENVRCFAGRHEHEIRPLTLLVGENSAGKSTFLAMLSAVSNPIGFPARPRFNDKPYNLGNFDTVATYKGGRQGRVQTFSIGYRIDEAGARPGHDVLATYRASSGQVELQSCLIAYPSYHAEITINQADDLYQASLEDKITGEVVSVRFDDSFIHFSLHHIGSLGLWLGARGEGPFVERIRSRIADSARIFADPLETLSLAPIRSKPRRTYDLAGDEDDPEGDDIPFLLDRIYSQESPGKAALIGALERFGQDSELLKKLDVRKLGNKSSDPIQIYVTASGRPANLLDVGYGVSQALPIVVRSVLLTGKKRLLLQQPEVHLHPKAQAALGSFFVDLVASGSRQFVIETHSDYIIDRIRMEVARGKLSPDLVSILYFERNGAETTIHEIEVDPLGNIVNAPPTYRSFFLQEELNLLTRAGK